MILEASAEDFATLIDGRAPRALALPDTPIAQIAVLQMPADLDARVRATFSPSAWLIVDGEEIVGLCSVMRAPTDGVIEIGYGIAPSRQGRGITGRAIADLVAWARRTRAVTALTADTGIDNFASQRVLERNDFHRVGARIDEEDGQLICWRNSLV
jgi:RimJ/RimL family protein N-acetyltransferase